MCVCKSEKQITEMNLNPGNNVMGLLNLKWNVENRSKLIDIYYDYCMTADQVL